MSAAPATRDPARPLGQPAAWLIAGFIAVVCTALMGMQAFHIWNQRSEVLAGARKDNANLASSLIQQAELTFRTADALLIGIVERLEHENDLEENGRERLRNWFLQEIRESPQFAVFAVVKSDGTTRQGSHRPIHRDTVFPHCQQGRIPLRECTAVFI